LPNLNALVAFFSTLQAVATNTVMITRINLALIATQKLNDR
jgi:hypothetical protein